MRQRFVGSLFAVLLFSGATVATSQSDKLIADWITKLDCGDVQQVVICQEDEVGDAFAKSESKDNARLLSLVTITNRAVIVSLIADLKVGLSNRIPVERLPFSGILSYQAFITKQKSFLVTHVILGEDGIVAVSTGSREDKGYRLASEGMLLMKSPSFSRAIQRAMPLHAKLPLEVPSE